MKLLTGLLVIVSLASLPSHAMVITLERSYEKLASMFSESCPAQAPSSGLDLFKSELLKCREGKEIPEPEELKLTGVPLGLDGDFPDEYLYASSFLNDYSFPARGRLNAVKIGELNGAWCSEVNNDLQFFQVDIGAVSTVTAIFTQGDHEELNWVQTYTLEISMDGYHWGCVFGSDGRVKVFDANIDSESVKINVMHPFIETRYIRIIPKSWTGHICLRVEIYVEEIVPREDKEDPEPIPDLETKVLAVNHKRPKALVVKNDEPNQVDTGMLPEQYTDQRSAPIKSISFEHLKLQPELYQVQPAAGDELVLKQDEDLEAEVLEVNPKSQDALIVKNDKPNQVDTGMLPEQYTDQRSVPIKSISFEHLKLQPDLYQVRPAGVVGEPLEPNAKVNPLVISGGGPVVDRIVAPGFYIFPVEVSTFGDIPPAYTFDYDWNPRDFSINMYLEFSFTYAVHIRGFSTVGHPGMNEWVSVYKVEYLHPYINEWVFLKGEDKKDVRIDGNSDDSSSRDHIYEPAIYTSRFRMWILEWQSRPYMTVQLYMSAEPREAPQIVTGPYYDGGLITWAWEEQEPEEGFTQEVYFKDELTLKAFEFGVESTIMEYELQYQKANKEWVAIFGDETSILSNGESPNVAGIVAKGLRIIIISWSDDRLYAEINLDVDKETEHGDVIDIVELSSHYLFYKWEDSEPIPGSVIYFNFGESRQVTRIETKGIDGTWVSNYDLECKSHFAEEGIELKNIAGNSNDEDIVEHIFSDPIYHCKYVLIKPDITGDKIGMEVYIYTDEKVEDATAKILIPGAKGGNTAGKWSPAEFGENPYIQFDFNHHITLTSITLEATEGSSVESFRLQKSSDGETFEPVLGENEELELGDTNFKGQFGVKGLRIFPNLPDNLEGGIGFEWDISFTSDETITVTPELFPGTEDEETDSSGPRVALNGNYIYAGEDAGQYVRFSFEKPETVDTFRLKGEYLGSTVTSFSLQWKTETSEDYFTHTVDGQEILTADEDGASIDMGGRQITELKVIILSAEGEGVKFEYQIEFTGKVGHINTSNAFLDNQEELKNL